MKTRYKVATIIGVILTLSSLAVLANYDFSNKDGGRFNYKDTVPITSDTYLDKTISEWQKESNESLMSYHKIYGDAFFEDLGALVIKNEMLQELDRQNIQPANPDFAVYSGMVLTSLPPHVSFEAFVNGTDNNTYRLSGMTMRAEVGDIHISKLEFFDTSIKLPLTSILSQNNTVSLEKQDKDKIAIPRNLIVFGNKDIQVNFENNFLVPIRIQGDGDWKDPNWYGPTILPMTSATMNFDVPGVYSWHARTLPLPGSTASDHMGGGEIFIISDNMEERTFQDKQSIGAAILQNSEIPWSAMSSGNDRGITIGINRAISDALPDYQEYYLARAKQLIPFDVPIILEN